MMAHSSSASASLRPGADQPNHRATISDVNTSMTIGRHERVRKPPLVASALMMSAAAMSSAALCAMNCSRKAACSFARVSASTAILSSTLPMMPPSPMNSDASLAHMARLEAELGLDHGDVAIVLQQHGDGALQAPSRRGERQRNHRGNDDGGGVHHATFAALATM